jgi:hypothetical protein
MSRLQHIAVVSGNYPTCAHPNRGTFVRQFVEAVAREGVRCTVIYPWKLHEWLRDRNGATPQSEASGGVSVHRPLMVSTSNRRLGPFNTFAMTQASFQQAVWRTLHELPEKPDAVYGHFLYSAGAAAVWAGTRLGRPSFVAVGESTGPGSEGLWSLQNIKPSAGDWICGRIRRFADAIVRAPFHPGDED